MDAEGLRPDACLAKVVAAARYFIEHVAGALAEPSPHLWRRNTVAAEQVASEEGAVDQVASEEGAAAQVASEEGAAAQVAAV
jgi:hypothetical protein